jgi:hypothetical protein
MKYFEAKELLLEKLEENDKLKAEIEKLDAIVKTYRKLYIDTIDERAILIIRIEQLKSELEQSIKLPCKVGDTIYLLDFEGDKYDEAIVEEIMITIDNKIEINSNYEIGTWSEDTYIKYSQEEAEQALKGEQTNDIN